MESPPPPARRASPRRLLHLLLVLPVMAVQLAGATPCKRDGGIGFGRYGSAPISALEAATVIAAAITAKAGAVPLPPDDIVLRRQERVCAHAVASWTAPADAAIAGRTRPPQRAPPQAV